MGKRQRIYTQKKCLIKQIMLWDKIYVCLRNMTVLASIHTNVSVDL